MGIVRWAMAAEHECSKSELRSKLEWSTIYTAKIALFYSCVQQKLKGCYYSCVVISVSLLGIF